MPASLKCENMRLGWEELSYPGCPKKYPLATHNSSDLPQTKLNTKIMLEVTALIPAVLAKLDKLPTGHAIDLRTYKRNRSVIIRKEGEESFYFVENGFYQDQFTVSKDKVKKTLKKMLKKEFPRSRKVRVYDLGAWDEKTDEVLHLKKL